MDDLRDMRPDIYQKNLGYLFRYLRTRKPKELIKHVDGTRGLDVGAGCCQYTEVLNCWGYDVVAVEPNRMMVNSADCIKVLSKGQHLPLRDDSFDFSFVINVLHHTEEPASILNEMGRVSERVVISELSRNNPLVRMFVKYKLDFDSIDDHLSEIELREIIEKSNLTLKKFYKTGLFGFPGIFMWAICE